VEKNQTKELIFSLKIILVGIFFWVIKIKYFTFFWLHELHFLNVFGLEIVGTVLIMIGIMIIQRIYPFAYTHLAQILIVIILIINICDFIFFDFKIYREFQLYTTFIMSIMLVLISKLLESGLKYFGNQELSKRWMYLAMIILYGISFPYYAFVSFKICGLIQFEGLKLSLKFVLLLIPIFISITSFFLYYIISLIKSFQFLASVQKGDDDSQIKTNV